MRRTTSPTFYPGVLSLQLWLCTNLLACFGWFAWYTCRGDSFGWQERVVLPVVITFFSMLTSILALPLAAWLFVIVVAMPPAKRLFYALLVVLFLWLQAAVIMAIIIPGTVQDFFGVMQLAAPHLAAAMVAAGLVYRHWLFRAEALDEGYPD
jgi:hypothetical protein